MIKLTAEDLADYLGVKPAVMYNTLSRHKVRMIKAHTQKVLDLVISFKIRVMLGINYGSADVIRRAQRLERRLKSLPLGQCEVCKRIVVEIDPGAVVDMDEETGEIRHVWCSLYHKAYWERGIEMKKEEEEGKNEM